MYETGQIETLLLYKAALIPFHPIACRLNSSRIYVYIYYTCILYMSFRRLKICTLFHSSLYVVKYLNFTIPYKCRIANKFCNLFLFLCVRSKLFYVSILLVYGRLESPPRPTFITTFGNFLH